MESGSEVAVPVFVFTFLAFFLFGRKGIPTTFIGEFLSYYFASPIPDFFFSSSFPRFRQDIFALQGHVYTTLTAGLAGLAARSMSTNFFLFFAWKHGVQLPFFFLDTNSSERSHPKAQDFPRVIKRKVDFESENTYKNESWRVVKTQRDEEIQKGNEKKKKCMSHSSSIKHYVDLHAYIPKTQPANRL